MDGVAPPILVNRWKAAYNQILVALLEDVRVFREAKRVKGGDNAGIYLIEVIDNSLIVF